MTRRLLAKKLAPLFLDEKKRDVAVRQLAAYLVAEGRTSEADLLLGDIALEMERLGYVDVQLVSARALSDSIKKYLKKIIKKQTGALQMTISEMIDESLIGGVVATTPSMEIDLSVRSKLKVLEAN